MPDQVDKELSRIPSLSHYCYRYINSHLDSVLSLGETPYPICEPILRSCSAEQLLALEKNSPHLENEDQAVWQNLCFRDFPRSRSQYENGDFLEPECWRKQFFVCRRSEEKRLEEIGTRIRSRREEADQEKKGRQVVYTDRLPPPKRSRYNPGPTKPKTLLEKTRAESIKIQRLVYGPAMLPSMPAKAMKPRTTVSHQSSRTKGMATTSPTKTVSNVRPTTNSPPSPLLAKPSATSLAGGHVTPKKDPLASLFMPKHRAQSHLSIGTPLSAQRK